MNCTRFVKIFSMDELDNVPDRYVSLYKVRFIALQINAAQTI